MAEQNLSALNQDPAPHAYDAPNLTPVQFMLAVMRDTTLPLSIRLDAASKVAPFTHPRPRPFESRLYESIPHRGTIVIGGLPTEAQSETTEIGSHFSPSSHIPVPHSGEPKAPVNIETIIDPLSPTDIQQIKSVVQRLHPDADLSQTPDHLTLCECGHWMLFPCKCASIH